MKTTAYVLALIGAVMALLSVALIAVIAGVTGGGSSTLTTAIVFGALVTVVAFLAAGMVRTRPGLAAGLLAACGLVFAWFAGWFALLATPLLLIAALLAFIGRGGAGAAQRRQVDELPPAGA